jgi:beta-galactosidase/beta-glucuronidase
MRASQQDDGYPRPQLRRNDWTELDGEWDFAFDDGDVGRAARWFTGDAAPFDRRIMVPFPPESDASGVGERGFHSVLWYRRGLPDEVLRGPDGTRTLVHFAAVDYRAEVWCDGQLVASHVGGQTPFTADVTDALSGGGDDHVLVVRAEDDPADVDQPRGKQDWRERPHDIWYERTSGIWQPVWVETVPATAMRDLAWSVDLPRASVALELELSRSPVSPLALDVTVRLGDELLAEQSTTLRRRTNYVDIAVDALRNGQDRDRLQWTPERPVLLDAQLRLRDRTTGETVDEVASYLGIRTVGATGGAVVLNGHPVYLRAVLNQGYRPDTHLASRGAAELRGEVNLIKRLGFNTVRVHQKAEDPRLLYWADRLGLMVWGETAAAYAWSPHAATLLTREWLELVRRDRSHPSVVAWVPINESWGVQDIAESAPQQHFSRAIAELTRALDPSRPVMSNEGWEHVESDMLGLHDYTTDPDTLRRRYSSTAATRAVTTAAFGPAGRRLVLGEAQRRAVDAGDTPLLLTEFGGISMSEDDTSWGYATVGSDEYADLLGKLFDALRASSDIAGFCYTQFLDTGQETNGLVFSDGRPKLPVEVIRAIVTGRVAGDGDPPPSDDAT